MYKMVKKLTGKKYSYILWDVLFLSENYSFATDMKVNFDFVNREHLNITLVLDICLLQRKPRMLFGYIDSFPFYLIVK